MKAMITNVPKHLGIILDGNRRFAKRLMLKPWQGHEWGYKKLLSFFGWCKELDIKEVTIYVFSAENFNRPKEEFDYLMNIFRKGFNDLINNSKIDTEKIKINVIGRIYKFPQDIQDKVKKITEKTKSYSNHIINIAMGYGGREEVVDATIKISEQVKKGELDINKINEEIFSNNLYLKSDVDLIIRTSGEKRTSGFLPWQGTYAELIFVDKYWPEFEKEDLLKCIEEYSNRDRRKGA